MRRFAITAFTAVAVTLSLAGPASALQPLQQIGSPGTGAGRLDTPIDVAISDGGAVYVTEQANNRVSVFAPSGSFVEAWGWDVRPGGGSGFEVCTADTGCKAGVAGGEAGQLDSPSGIAIDESGAVHVAEFSNHRISEFTPSGAFLRARGFGVAGGSGLETCTAAPPGCEAGVGGGAAGQLDNPVGLAIDAAGNTWVAESSSNRIDQFGPSGEFIKGFGFDVNPDAPDGPEVCTTATGCQSVFGSPEAGGFNGPRDVELRGEEVYVADGQNLRIGEWTTAGEFVSSWGLDVVPGGATGFEACTVAPPGCQAGGDSPAAGAVRFPQGVAFDGAGRLTVAELENNRVSQFSTAPSFVRGFGFNVNPTGGAGFETCTTATGCLQGGTAGFGALDDPRGVTADCRGGVWVPDENDRVQRFGEAGTPPPPCNGPSPPGPLPPPPSNDFSFGKAKKNKKKGTAKLTVAVPGPGDLDLAQTKKVKGAERRADAAGRVRMTIKPRGNAKRRLRRTGKANVAANVTFTPDGGDPNTERTDVRLKRKG